MSPQIYAIDSTTINKLAQFHNRKINVNFNDIYMICSDNGVYLGFAKLTINKAENSVELKILKVSEHFQGTGIGNFMLSHIIEYSKKRSMKLYGKINSVNRDINKVLSLCRKNHCKAIEPIGNLYSIGIAEWERFLNKTCTNSSLNYNFKIYNKLTEVERNRINSYNESTEYRHLYPLRYDNIYNNDFSIYLFHKDDICGWCISDFNNSQELFIYSVYIVPYYRKYNAGIHLLKYVTFGNYHKIINDIETVSFCLLSDNIKAINILDTFSKKGYTISKNEFFVVDFI